MAVTYDAYEAKAYSNAIKMLATSSTFQTGAGAVDVAGAKERIIEFFAGDPEKNEVAPGKAYPTTATGAVDNSFRLNLFHGLVHQAEFTTSDLVAFGYESRQDNQMNIDIRIPRLTALKPPEQFRTWLNTMGAIRAELNAQFGGTNSFALGSVNLINHPIPDATKALADSMIGRLTINWRTP